MNKELRKAISDEIHRRHGYRFMEAKIKPVHIANSLMRNEHQCVGRMSVLEQLFEATLTRNSIERRLDAAQAMIDGHRERWGRLGETNDLKSSILMTRLLPLIRTLLGADGAAFGTSPELSSFSSPTALTVTGDVSDDGAGNFIHCLWGGHDEGTRGAIIDILSEITSPTKSAGELDDLSALFAPLVDGTRKKPAPNVTWEGLSNGYSPVERALRDASDCLAAYERKLKPNPIATLQRIVLLAALSVFVHASTRLRERYALEERVLLLDASGDPYSTVATASTRCVSQIIGDGRKYMAHVLRDLLRSEYPDWHIRPMNAINGLLEKGGKAPIETNHPLIKRLANIQEELDLQGLDKGELEGDLADELIRFVEGSSGRGLDGYLRLLGVRSGFLYPQQKNPNKRLVPTDRMLEVIVASVIDVSRPPIEYRDFLEQLLRRWSIIVGGRVEDAELLLEIGTPVPRMELSRNSERFLSRLEAIGLARRLADSVAVVGLLEDPYE